MENEEVTPRKSDKAAKSVERTQSYIRKLATIVAVVVIVTGFITSALVTYLTLSGDQQRKYLIECTTPGPREPTMNRPTTGHNCFDESQARAGQFVVVIGDDVEERVCKRLEQAFNETDHRPITLTCTRENK